MSRWSLKEGTLMYSGVGYYKEDVIYPLFPKSAYAETVRRHIVDFAAKIVRHAGRITLKVTPSDMGGSRFPGNMEAKRRTAAFRLVGSRKTKN